MVKILAALVAALSILNSSGATEKVAALVTALVIMNNEHVMHSYLKILIFKIRIYDRKHFCNHMGFDIYFEYFIKNVRLCRVPLLHRSL